MVTERAATPDKDLELKIRHAEVNSEVKEHVGRRMQVVWQQSMSTTDFIAYTSTLKQCEPPFRYDKDGSVTGREQRWYRYLADKPEPKRKLQSQPGPSKQQRTQQPQPGSSHTLQSHERASKQPKHSADESEETVDGTVGTEKPPTLYQDLVSNIDPQGLVLTDIRRIIGAMCAAAEHGEGGMRDMAQDLYLRWRGDVVESDGAGSSEAITQEFEEMWVPIKAPEFDQSHLPFERQVLMHYSREAHEDRHIELVGTSLFCNGSVPWYQRTFTEVDLRDFVIALLGDLFITVEEDPALYIWWQKRWTKSIRHERLNHMILECVLQLYRIAKYTQLKCDWNGAVRKAWGADERDDERNDESDDECGDERDDENDHESCDERDDAESGKSDGKGSDEGDSKGSGDGDCKWSDSELTRISEDLASAWEAFKADLNSGPQGDIMTSYTLVDEYANTKWSKVDRQYKQTTCNKESIQYHVDAIAQKLWRKLAHWNDKKTANDLASLLFNEIECNRRYDGDILVSFTANTPLIKSLFDGESEEKQQHDHDNKKNTQLRQLVVDKLRAYSLPMDPFDRNHNLFCFTNATFDLREGVFVPQSKFNLCMMNCGRPWIEPTEAQNNKVSALFDSILPKQEMREGYTSVLKSGLSGTRPENFVLANGGGRNGKGVLNELMSYTAGSYASEGHLALLTQPIKDGPNPEAANLHRKRWLVFSEPEDGFNESLRLSCIKKLTGGDTLSARACHSNKTEVELHATIIMECNKQPPVTGEKGEAALERVRVFPFEMTFTDDEDKLQAAPEKFKPKDESLKTPQFKEEHRCAFFRYIVEHGGDAPRFPAETKALGAKYLSENDELSIWVADRFEKTEAVKPVPVAHFISIKDLYESYVMSDCYQLMTKAEKRRVTQTSFQEVVQKNLVLKSHFVEAKKVMLDNGKYNSKIGLVNFRHKSWQDEEDNGIAKGVPVGATSSLGGHAPARQEEVVKDSTIPSWLRAPGQ